MLDDANCGNSVLKNILSPNKQLQAVIFEVRCNYQVEPDLNIAIIPSNKLLTLDNPSFFTMENDKGGLNVDIIWHSNTDLEIQYPKLAARIFRAEKNANGVNIVYRTHPE